MSLITLSASRKSQPIIRADTVAINGTRPTVVLSGVPGLKTGLSAFSAVGTPTIAAHRGGIGHYFGTGNYFSVPVGNTVGAGSGTGNEISRCFFEVFVVGVGSNAATSAFFSENSSTPADGNEPWILQNNAGTLRQYAYGVYTNIKAVSAGEVVTIVRRYSDFSPYPQETWCNGELVRSFNQYRLTGAFLTHAYFGTGYPGAFTGGVLIHYAAYPGTLISQQQASDISRNPWGATYHSGGRILYFPSAGGGGATTGSFAVTESGSDTADFDGLVKVAGSFAVTEAGSDTSDIDGLVKVSGSYALTESGSDSALFEGYFPVEGIPTLTSATVTAVTRTTATPRVTITFP